MIRSRSLIPSEQPERIAHCRSFVLSVSDLCDSLTSLRRNERIFFFNYKKTVKTYKNTIFRFFKRFAHSLICLERPERIAHIRSFVMSDLRDLLTVALLLHGLYYKVLCSVARYKKAFIKYKLDKRY